MIAQLINRVACAAILALGMVSWHTQAAEDPLASWNDGPAKQAIVRFVGAVTTAGNAGYVDPAGVATQRVVAPINVRGGQLTAYDPASGRVREFAIHRVSSVVSADDR